jgi:glycosyltransferase involved in cell wall biosynthesis
MLAYTFYENDGRVMRYAETLVQEGAEVDVIVLRKDLQPVEEAVNGINVLRIQKRKKNESGKVTYLLRIIRFFFLSMVEITRRHLKEPFDVIHVHSVPDFEVFAAWIPKLLGAKVILDIHDIVPEFYAAKFNVGHDSPVFAALKLVERMSAGFADHVITANDLWFSKITTRSVRPEKCSVFINYPDMSLFSPLLRRRGKDGKFILIYPGSLHWHQGLDIAVKAFALASHQEPGMEFHIYGEGSAKPELAKLIVELRLQDCVFLKDPMPMRQIADFMANADLGVVPKRNDSFGGEAFSTKILEFMALGTPVVVAATRIDRHYFDDTLLRFFNAGDETDLALKMLDAYRNRALSRRLAENSLEYAKRVSWANKRGEYIGIVSTLVGERK